MSIIENKTLVELHEGLRNKEFTSVELTKETFERIHALEPKVEAFVTLNEEEALKQAAAADEKGYGEEVSVEPPMANSSMFNLPTLTAPSAFNNSITCAS